MPPSPSHGVVAGRCVAVVMACLALVWWGSLAFDASLGRASWWSVLLAAALWLAWLVPVYRWAKALKPQAERLVYWHPPALRHALDDPSRQRAPVRWTDEEGNPLDLRVEMDLGAGVLVRVQTVDAGARRTAQIQWRWIDGRSLRGPWRWRLMSAGRLSSVPADECGTAEAMVASWAQTPSQKAILPKPARRSA